MTISLRISEERRLRNCNDYTADDAEEDKQSEVEQVILSLIYLLHIFRELAKLMRSQIKSLKIKFMKSRKLTKS